MPDDRFAVSTPQEQLPLPHNLEAEQGVIGAVLMDNKVFRGVSGLLTPEAFYEPMHSQIYTIMAEMIAAGKPATPVTMKSFIQDSDLGGMTTSQYLARLCNEVPSLNGAAGLAQLIVDLHKRRQMIAAAAELTATAFDSPINTSPSVIAAKAITGLQEVARSPNDRAMVFDAGESATEVLDLAEAIRKGEKQHDACSTGFDDIDRMTGGYEAGLLWIIGARPSMGKTTHMFASARRAARRGAGVVVFSLEDDQRNGTARILADAAWSPRQTIEYGRIYRGADLTDDEVWRLRELAESFKSLPMVMDFSSTPTTDEIAVKVRAEKERMAKRGERLRVVFIDYLDFIKSPDRYSGNRNYEKGMVTKALKVLARDEQVCIVLYSQLNRANEQLADKRPTLTSLRDSGELEQDANVVAFIHRESYYVQRSTEYANSAPDALARFAELENKCEFIIAKNKAGAVKTVNLWCDMAASSMADMGRF